MRAADTYEIADIFIGAARVADAEDRERVLAEVLDGIRDEIGGEALGAALDEIRSAVHAVMARRERHGRDGLVS